jgi:hypothetical protein
MSFYAANPTSFSYPSSCPVESANKNLPTRNPGGELRPSYSVYAGSNLTAIGLKSVASVQMTTLLWRVSAVMYTKSCSVTASGPFRRPAALGLLLRVARPLGVSVPPSLRTTAKYASQISFGPLPESRPSALGSRAHSLSSAQCDPSNNGRIQQTETLSCTRTK